MQNLELVIFHILPIHAQKRLRHAPLKLNQETVDFYNNLPDLRPLWMCAMYYLSFSLVTFDDGKMTPS